MVARTRKHLNIRSDEAYATAHDLAEQFGTTTTEVVVRALRELQFKRRVPSRPSGSLSPNHDDLYDEFGLPE